MKTRERTSKRDKKLSQSKRRTESEGWRMANGGSEDLRHL